MKKAKFSNPKWKILEVFQEFYFCRNFLRILLTVSGVTPINDAISLSVIYWGKSGQRCNSFI